MNRERCMDVQWLRRLVWIVATIVAFGLTVWAAAAIYFDSPFAHLRTIAGAVYLIVVLVAMVVFRRHAVGLLVAFAGFALVALWWSSLKPANDRNWEPDNVETAYADINGDEITIHNFRNCDYRTEQDYTCRWETRTFNLANLRGADIFITWWGSPWIAHPIVSFDFGDPGHAAMSIETRDEVGQEYSAVRGFFRQYALTYIAADERDVIRLRTNYRKDEEVYLFRTAASAPLARKLFVDYLLRANELHARPEWYNALTNNCTTNIAVSAAAAQKKRTSLDWRILLNGKMDELMYERHALVTDGLPLPALREQAHINPRAKVIGDNPDFSQLIREGRVGFPTKSSSAAGSSQ
jgi:uncharacterized protein DUF4105